MDEPEIPPNNNISILIALALVVSPAVLLMTVFQWSPVRNDGLEIAVILGGPVVGGVISGVLLSRALARTLAARIVTGLLLCPVCVVASLAIALIGCSIVNPIRS